MIKGMRRYNLLIHQSEDKRISIAVMSTFVILTIQYFVLIYFNLINTQYGSNIQIISKLVVGIFFLYALPVVLKRHRIKFIIPYFIALLILLINYLLYSENQYFLKELIFPFFFMSLPVFLYSLSIRNWAVLKNIMKKASYIVLFLGIILSLLVILGKSSIGIYSMPLSYYMLLPAIMLLDDLLDKFSIKNLILLFISIMVILSLGSRGAILCILIFTLLKLIRFNYNLTYKKIIYYLILIGVFFVSFLYLNSILKYLFNLLFKLGVNSRSISLFLDEDVYLSGRDIIYDEVISAIINSPILGIGIGGDRRIAEGTYAHNIFIELLSSFGLLIGFIIIFILILLILKLLLTKNKDKYNMIIIWVSLGFVHLFISSSFITDMRFWIFLGILINGLLSKNVNIKKVT